MIDFCTIWSSNDDKLLVLKISSLFHMFVISISSSYSSTPQELLTLHILKKKISAVIYISICCQWRQAEWIIGLKVVTVRA